jgi:leucyl/phenylalanyl-tRNA--protein transferase
MQSAYVNLHQLGFAHSIEVWQTKEFEQPVLVGGLYGVAINGFFSGESMFYTSPNASKFALVALAQLLSSMDIDFIDCQLLNDFLSDMGATEISRENFLVFKQTAINKEVAADFWQPRELSII